MADAATLERPSTRGASRRERRARVLSPLEQIRVPAQGVTYGAWAYYLRPDGATIRDAVILYPSGGIPDHPDPKMRARYGTSADEVRARQARKGFEFLGSRLNKEAVRKIVATIEANREDEILWCEEVIKDAEDALERSVDDRWRTVYKRRIDVAHRRIETMLQPFDPDALVAELDEISQAQRMASIDPKVLQVMRELVGEVNTKTEAMIAHFQKGRTHEDGDSAPTGVRITRGRGKGGAEFEGTAVIDED